jgi:hypothetical protein
MAADAFATAIREQLQWKNVVVPAYKEEMLL